MKLPITITLTFDTEDATISLRRTVATLDEAATVYKTMLAALRKDMERERPTIQQPNLLPARRCYRCDHIWDGEYPCPKCGPYDEQSQGSLLRETGSADS